MSISISLKTMLNKVEGLIDTGDVNDWENGFLKLMMTKSKAGVDLSTKEFAIVERIHNKHFA
jgi:hypothetical protein